ncbi:MAG: protein-glutamate O-methyltransferase CheR [Alphaproteobacteria bacterium]|nr:protein-glutamate O-methyltransferase CheR [Alphaproteobacteria bacterium]MCB9694795.1 protein-glutamate O-methyltransferase CheR [Alphaproteobacteria bacterium]
MTSAASKVLSPQVFSELRALVEGRYGIQLEGKEDMVQSRIGPLARKSGLPDADTYIRHTLQRGSPAELSALVDSLTTNHTHFHREAEHFDVLAREALPPLIDMRRRTGDLDIRMWCAAASTGQEPYQLAMILNETLGPDASRWRRDLLATDISENALQKAREARYKPEDVERMPEQRTRRWMRREGDRYTVVPELQQQVVYRRLNLLRPSYPFKQPMDIVFVRNVMIYFDLPTRLDIVRKMHRVVAPGGWLFISLSETLPHERDGLFRFVRPGVYRR